jgi:ketol-acid reductoisomerase
MKIGLIGYGSQGRAEALNLRKSKIEFRLGLRQGASWQKALEDGFRPETIENCLQHSEVVFINLPDQAQAEFYRQSIRPHSHIRWLVFAHGFSTAFKLIPVEPLGAAHILIAPKGAASGLESFFGTSKALPGILSFEATEKNPIGEDEKNQVESLAKGVGCHPKALFWSQFRDEAICDLFSEQALLCGGVSHLLTATYETLVEAGYRPETAYFETLYELKLIVDLIWEHGISGMRDRISPTARYGDITRGRRVIDSHVKSNLKNILAEIESGEFTQEFLSQCDSPAYRHERDQQSRHEIEKLGRLIREKSKL